MRQTLIALILCMTLGLTACTETPTPPPDEPSAAPTPSAAPVRQDFTLPYDPNDNLHPILSSNRTNAVLTSLVYQGLFELDNTFTPHEVLCSGYSVSDDQLVWTFTIGNSVFSDGSPVTAADVVYSINLARTSTLYGSRLSDIQSISAGENGTVILTLSTQNSLLPTLLDIPVIRDSKDGSMPLGTGPYRFVEDTGSMRLVRNPSASDTLPEEIPLLAVEDADDLIYAFDSGSISLTVSDLTGANALGYSAGYEAFDFPTTTMLYVGFQTASGPCADPLVRQAISRSFDRETVASSLLAGHADATCLPFSPHSPLYSSDHEAAGGYNPTAVETLLRDAGYAKGEDGILRRKRSALELTFVVNTDNSFKLAIADYLTEQLINLGMEVTLKKLAWDDYLAALEHGEFDLYLGEVTLTADFDLRPLIDAEGTLNFGHFQSIQMDTAHFVLHFIGTESSFLLDQFQNDAPFAPLCFKRHSVLTRWQAVSGLEPTRQNPFYHLESLRFNAVK